MTNKVMTTRKAPRLRRQIKDAAIAEARNRAFASLSEVTQNEVLEAINELNSNFALAVDDAVQEAEFKAQDELGRLIDKYGYSVLKAAFQNGADAVSSADYADFRTEADLDGSNIADTPSVLEAAEKLASRATVTERGPVVFDDVDDGTPVEFVW